MAARCRFGAALLAACLVALSADAADEGLVLRQSAERLAAAGSCEEAIATARRARQLAPSDAQAAAIEGRCAIALKRYDDALAPLETALRLDPSLPGVAADLAMAQYHRGDFDAADRALSQAEKQDPDAPKVLLYRGLLHLERAENVEAATALERAARADAAIDPLASYYAAGAWHQARERQKARDALERVGDGSPASPWAQAARDSLARIDSAADVGIGEWWVNVSAGMEWDDNVLLRSNDTSLPNPGTPSQISNEQDWLGLWSAEAGAELIRTANWAGGAMVGYRGNAHVDLKSFDIYNPATSIWLDRRVGEQAFFRLQPYFSYMWISTQAFSDPYVGDVGGVFSYNQSFDEAGSGRLYTQFAYQDWMDDTHDPITRAHIFDAFGNDLTDRRDRDGTDFRVGYDHLWPMTDSTTLRGGLSHGRYEAEGAEYSHLSYRGYLGFRQSLPLEFAFDAEGGYSHEPYRRASTFPSPDANHVKRRDNLWMLRLAIERPITELLSVTAHWRYTSNDSNTPSFDYDRNVLGGYFTLSFGP
jgi:tetratricopeptide (TPR) repeat protein